MNKITLKELSFENHKITFHKGLNYIIGANNTGKTTMYNMIQFVLGIKKEINMSLKRHNFSTPVSLLCNIGEQEVLFERHFNSEYLNIQYGITNEYVKHMSLRLKEVYDILFEPFFVLEKEDGAAYEILKHSFLSESRFDVSRGRNEIFKKILGINVLYMKQANKDYNDLKIKVDKEKNSIELLETFIHRVLDKNNKLNTNDSVKFKDLLENEYKLEKENYITNYEFLHTAKQAIIRNEEYLDEYFDKRVSLIEPYYLDFIAYFSIGYNIIDFRDFYKSNHNQKAILSGSIFYITLLCFMIALNRSGYDEKHNGCGLLISDLSLYELDFNSQRNLEKLLRQESQSGMLQFVEFTGKQTKELSADSIVFDLNSVERFL
ncbi:ATP-binding protein [Peribacillus sp. YIM B13472]|uniref:ATP-binding protein n=1 Tax=Peribacillus sp. YIM B13472 TaxID=3366297 RepID=UPI00366B35B7